MKRRSIAGVFAAIACAVGVVAAPADAAVLDRVVARFSDPEAGEASASLRFVMMRELILEAWLVAYERAPAGESPVSFDDKQLRAALERHVIEDVLSERLPSSTPQQKLKQRVDETRFALRIAVDDRLDQILQKAGGGATGGGIAELESILQRRARAETYLELAVAEPVEVTEGELRTAWAHPPKMLETMEFEKAVPALRVLVRAVRLREAAQAYYQAVRARLHMEIIQG